MYASDPGHGVLIVEDERIVAKDLQQTLVAMGYDAFAIASSAEEAMNHASLRCPDLVLMDIRIKGNCDGIDTAALLRERFDVPVVYLTAHADAATVERAKRTEPHGYLMKPVKPAELRSAIEVSIYKHQAEQQLRARERRFSTALRSIADAVITVDIAGTVTFMNQAAETLTSTTVERAIGRPVRDVVGHLYPGRTASPIDQVLEQRQPVVTHEAELDDTRPGDRVIHDRASLVVDDDEVLGAVMVFRDVTAHKVMQKQLELSDRLASLATMAAGVRHEINNPLAIIMANAAFVHEDLERQRAGDPEAPLDLTEILAAQADVETAAKRIAGIVSELELFSRPARAVDGWVDVERAITWAVRSTAHELGSRAVVEVDHSFGAAAVKLDETRLGYILVNLLLNAANAIPPDHYNDHRVTIRTRREAGLVMIEVRDTGVGMSAEIRRRIFEPFFTSPAGTRSGLGLAVCHSIATAAGGRLEVESEVGSGSVFRLVLADTGAPPGVPSPPQPASAPLRGRILAVDDEPMVLTGVARMLRDHEVVCVDDARAGLAMLERGESFDLILSDVMMPAMTGMELYERLLVTRPEIAQRVVFLTGGAVTGQLREFLAVVPNVLLHKPIGVHELREVVQRLLAAAQS